MKILLAVAIVLFGSIAVFAQEISIEKIEFNKVVFKHLDLIKGKPTRTIEEVIYEKASGTETSKSYIEKDRMSIHSILEIGSASGIKRTESIFINRIGYSKNADNSWRRIQPPGNWLEVPNVYLKTRDGYKTLGAGLLNGKKVQIYATTLTRKNVSITTSNLIISIVNEKFYVDEFGVIVKYESNSETINTPKIDPNSATIQKETRSFLKTTRIFEIDPTIKIEEPIIQ